MLIAKWKVLLDLRERPDMHLQGLVVLPFNLQFCLEFFDQQLQPGNLCS
jgi:hypothetical protein